MNVRRRLHIQGNVQGIGFRPFLYRLATERRLTGGVCNDGCGVTVDVEGSARLVEQFEARLPAEMPIAGRIDRWHAETLPPRGGGGTFRIEASRDSAWRCVSLVPDQFVCPDCLREMNDPRDRRYRYPFINCTACGPRYTIARELPYDRRNTTMASFAMCPDCRREYHDPADRRYHAQPIACPDCGPRVWLVLAGEEARAPRRAANDDPAEAIDRARQLLAAGKIVAVKGIGGFHLAVDARDQAAVSRLRERKHRPRKPLAILVRDLEMAGKIVRLDAGAERLLRSPAAPIVIAPARPGHGLAAGLAPGIGDLGVMLPYSPLHHLLVDSTPDALVMTSGNLPGEPIATGNDEALASLPADAFLLHDRDIHLANDDSVVRASGRGATFVRRSRGYVPDRLDASRLPDWTVLALGAELKVTLSVLHGGRLTVGRHLGDLGNPRAERAFRDEVQRVLRQERLRPRAVAFDLHPDLTSSLYAEQAFGAIRRFRVQHHHAHMCAVLAEHGLGPETQAVGIVLDGLGYGPDGTFWGGEVLAGGYTGFERVASLRPVPQPGGDKAALEPARMATSLLLDAGLEGTGSPAYRDELAPVCRVASVSPPTSSAGRLFDGVAAILGVAPATQDYDGEAAARLESIADPAHGDAYPLPFRGGQLDTRELTAAIVDDRSPLPLRAARFHNGLADGLIEAGLTSGMERVVLAGGCLVNRLLLGRLADGLRRAHVEVLCPVRLPVGDGGLSAGQAAIAACLLEWGTKACV